jgi:hypothetical protein
MPLLQANPSTNPYLNVAFVNDVIRVLDGANVFKYETDAVFRDNSAWYHIVAAIDTTQSAEADRVKIYVNGVSQDITITKSFTQNYETQVNATTEHRIGRWLGTSSNYLHGYLADYYFIDGSALGATDFGAFDSNGVWQAAEYSGTFGTNGFHLKFADASSDAALGTDSSGNDNTFTVNNITAKAPGKKGSQSNFDAVLYTGTGSPQTVSTPFAPDFVWIKRRNGAASHVLNDTVRGANKRLSTNTTAAEEPNSAFGYLSAFTSSGFTLTAGSSGDDLVCNSGDTYVAWCWKAGGTAASNTDGTITSSVSANTEYGFSIATISSATGSSTASLGHGLGAQPNIIIQKSRTNTYGWQIYAKIGASYKYLSFSGDAASSTTTANMGITPTSSTVGLGSNFTGSNNYVYYCWTEISGFSKFSTYTGTGSSHHVDCGFKPAFVMVKCTSSSNCNWHIFDNHRGDERLVANLDSDQGNPATYAPTFSDTGFTVANVTDTHTNASGQTYFFMAFAATPPGENDDSVFDVPTNGTQSDTGAGGEVSGNYCVLNPLDTDSSGKVTVSNGNLTATGNSNRYGFARGTIGVTSGKYYFEASVNGNNAAGIGVCEANAPDQDALGDRLIATAYRNYVYCGSSLQIFINGSSVYTGSAVADGDIIGVAVDVDAGKVWFSQNGVYQGSGTQDPGAGTGGYSPTNIDSATPLFQDGGGSPVPVAHFNFGQREFAFDAPSNFKALCTTNLPTATVPDGSDYFDAKTYSGNGGTQTISSLSFELDFLWIKCRNDSVAHYLGDTVRGINKNLQSNGTNAEVTNHPNGYVSAVTSNGFTVTDGSSNDFYTNGSTETYVAWAWDAGSSTVSNTDGSITSSVRANQTAGFSIVSWTGTGSAGTIGHGLNSAPELIIGKNRGNTTSWIVGAAPANDWSKVLLLDSTAALTTNGNFNNTAPTSSVFSVGTGSGLNQNTQAHIAYCISSVAGFSAVGSYVGNGSSDGPFVFTGFRPAFLMWKLSSASGGNWNIEDTGRSPTNPVTVTLRANTTEADLTTSQGQIVDLLSNGFRVKNTSGQHNTSGATYIYWAVAENPFSSNGGLAR